MKFKYWWINLRCRWRLWKAVQRAKKENRRCAAQYPDWRDDEFNMGPCKFIWGIQRSKEARPSFCTLNDITVYYNRDTDLYFLLLDFPANLQQAQDKIKFLIQCLQAFQIYMQSLPDGYTFSAASHLEEGFEAWNLSGKTIDELYTKFTILLYGYQKALKTPQ